MLKESRRANVAKRAARAENSGIDLFCPLRRRVDRNIPDALPRQGERFAADRAR